MRLALVAAALVGCSGTTPRDAPDELVFVALEGSGTVGVIDARRGTQIASVDLTEHAPGELRLFAPHNVQVDPETRMTWVTAPPYQAGGHDHMSMTATASDELVGIDEELGLAARIQLGPNQHAAHVVTHGGFAYVTAHARDAVLVVDLLARKVSRRIALPPGSGPHGVRISQDGETLAVAGLGGSLLIVETSTGNVESVPLPSGAVQTALTADGKVAFATLHDTHQVARYELASQRLELWTLPEGAVGPVQLYLSLDERRVWVADQGASEGEPIGNTLFALDATTGSVELVASVGAGPHGVLVSPTDGLVWVTLLRANAVQALDPDTGAIVMTIPVRANPNGISYWARRSTLR